jgi:hypothetical protein
MLLEKYVRTMLEKWVQSFCGFNLVESRKFKMDIKSGAHLIDQKQ